MELESIKKLTLAPGDIVVIKSKQALSSEAMRNIESAMKRVAPGHKLVLLADDLDLEVLSAPQA